MNLFLIGLPGSGKSTLGREIALELNLKMVDTDAEIVTAEGKSIEEIFRVSGEDYFRRSEQTILHKISGNDKQLISTGGGMPCFFDNMEYMKKKGVTLFIDVPVENLHQRLIGQRSQKRPMLEGENRSRSIAIFKTKIRRKITLLLKSDGYHKRIKYKSC